MHNTQCALVFSPVTYDIAPAPWLFQLLYGEFTLVFGTVLMCEDWNVFDFRYNSSV